MATSTQAQRYEFDAEFIGIPRVPIEETAAEGTFEPAAFAAPLRFKNIRLALTAAENLNVPMPLASLLHDRFVRLFAQGGDQLDWAAIGGLAGQDAGHRQHPVGSTPLVSNA
jgi:hypothetical protein